MKLWKIYKTDDFEYKDLMNNDYISYDQNYESFCEENDPWLRPIYKWLAKQLQTKQEEKEFPFHLYCSIEGSTNPIKNQLFGLHRKGKYIQVVFNINDADVKLYDDDLFIVCLNYGFLSSSQKEDEQFDNYMKCFPKLGINHTKLIKDENYIYTLTNSQQGLAKTFLKTLHQSWKLIFNLHLPANDWIGQVNQNVMGMTWRLKKKDIIDVIEFELLQDRDPYELYD